MTTRRGAPVSNGPDASGRDVLVTATEYGSPERAPEGDLHLQRRIVRDEPNVCRMLDMQPEPTLVLNEQRQIVFANRASLDLFGATLDGIVGRRFGEALHCIHAFDAPAGCGTTKYCTMCGTARAIREARLGQRPATASCRITRRNATGPEALEFRIWSTPLVLAGRTFIVVAARDASNEQRRHVLERMFFHDLLNTSGALQMLLKLVSSGAITGPEAVTRQASRLTAELIEEIETHRDLLAAERGELVRHTTNVSVAPLLHEAAQTYSHYRDVTITVAPCSPSAVVASDRVMLRRILTNLLKNAIEASGAGDRVELAFETSAGPAFHVTNPAVMPADVQLQVFQRSFSTKAAQGRGLGTYGARLIAERYLDSRLSFDSGDGRGTTFTLCLPAGALVRS